MRPSKRNIPEPSRWAFIVTHSDKHHSVFFFHYKKDAMKSMNFLNGCLNVLNMEVMSVEGFKKIIFWEDYDKLRGIE